MDDLSKLLNNLMSQTQDNADNSPQGDAQEMRAQDEGQESDAEQAGNFENFDISGLLSSFSSPPSSSSGGNYASLLAALKPYLRPERRRAVERIQNLTGTAHSIRAVLAALDTKEGVQGV